MSTSTSRLAKFLLALAMTFFLVSVICGVGWFLAARQQQQVTLDNLGLEDRQRLVEDFLSTQANVFEAAWFEPRIAYTLRRQADIEAWGSTFRSNELGYRSGPAAKAAGTFRVLFVGDSWTYGMGVSENEAFPAQFEILANQLSEGESQIEAWSLALPGYNLLNELAALEFFFDRLQPDAVILCPTTNDADSSPRIVNGFLKVDIGRWDDFGFDHSLVYANCCVESHRFASRWRQAFEQVDAVGRWLKSRNVPFLVAFLTGFQEEHAHGLMVESSVQHPYLIVPTELTRGKWVGPPPWWHGTPEAYTVLARLIYNGFAELVGWPQASNNEFSTPVFHRPPNGDWQKKKQQYLTRRTRERIRDSFVPHKAKPGSNPCAGPMDCVNGLMGHATTVLVRRAKESREVVIALRKVPTSESLYPLDFVASIPSAGSGSRVATTIPADDSKIHRFTLEIPPDIPVGAAMDVELRADRIVSAPDALAPRSAYVVKIEQEP